MQSFHRPERVLALVIFVVSASWSVFGQVQSNSLEASFTIDGRAGSGYEGRSPVLVADGHVVGLVISGEPSMPFVIAAANRAEPGMMTSAGILNLDTFLVFADGFQPPGDAFLDTGPSGAFGFGVDLDFLPHGTELALQVLVASGAGNTLTAPGEIARVPGDQIPSDFAYRMIPASFSAGNRHAVVADVNNDGNVDYVNSSAIWAGDGALSFDNIFIDPAGVEAAVGDLVGDSNPDLVMFDDVFGGLRIYEGNGSGGFVGLPVTQIAIEVDDVGDVAIADLDGDGDSELIVASGLSISRGLTILDNQGGTFVPIGNPGAQDSRAVAVGDYDGDENLDIAAEFIVGNSRRTVVLWGNGSLNYGLNDATTIIAIPELGSQWLDTADLDGDGIDDLVWAGATNQGAVISDGVRGFSYSPISVGPVVGAPLAQMTVGDFDNDANADIAFIARDGTTSYVVIAAGDGTGAFPTSWFVPVAADPTTPAGPGHALAADLDNDGDDDLAVGGYPASFVINDN